MILTSIYLQHLCGLRLQFNALTNEGMMILGPVIAQFSNLVSLDLSCNNIDLLSHDSVCTCMAEMFQCLPYLTRLDLSSNWIKTKLRTILTGIPQPLRYLKLSGCGLRACDLQYLCDSHHITALSELDLSENNLGRDFDIFKRLLDAVAKNLILLELEDCEISEDHLLELVKFVPKLHKLKFWNLSRNTFFIDTQLVLVKHLVQMAELEAVKVSFPNDVFVSAEESEINEEKAKFSLSITTTIADLCTLPGCRHVRWIHAQ